MFTMELLYQLSYIGLMPLGMTSLQREGDYSLHEDASCPYITSLQRLL